MNELIQNIKSKIGNLVLVLSLALTICFSASEAADKVRISVSSLDVAFLTAAGTGY